MHRYTILKRLVCYIFFNLILNVKNYQVACNLHLETDSSFYLVFSQILLHSQCFTMSRDNMRTIKTKRKKNVCKL